MRGDEIQQYAAKLAIFFCQRKFAIRENCLELEIADVLMSCGHERCAVYIAALMYICEKLRQMFKHWLTTFFCCTCFHAATAQTPSDVSQTDTTAAIGDLDMSLSVGAIYPSLYKGAVSGAISLNIGATIGEHWAFGCMPYWGKARIPDIEGSIWSGSAQPSYYVAKQFVRAWGLAPYVKYYNNVGRSKAYFQLSYGFAVLSNKVLSSQMGGVPPAPGYVGSLGFGVETPLKNQGVSIQYYFPVIFGKDIYRELPAYKYPSDVVRLGILPSIGLRYTPRQIKR